MSRTKLYFETIDDSICYPLEHHLHNARIDGLNSIKLIEAIPDNAESEYVWCSHEGEVTERTMCKKSQCPYYSSKSGRGVCEHRGRLYGYGRSVEFKVENNE